MTNNTPDSKSLPKKSSAKDSSTPKKRVSSKESGTEKPTLVKKTSTTTKKTVSQSGTKAGTPSKKVIKEVKKNPTRTVEKKSAPMSEEKASSKTEPKATNNRIVNVKSSTSSDDKVNVNDNKSIVNEASKTYYSEEFITERKTKKRRWVKIIIASIIFLLAGIIIGAAWSQIANNAQSNPANSSSESTQNPTPAVPLSDTDKQQLAGSMSSDTINVIGGQLTNQYGESIKDTVTLANGTDVKDSEGNAATVALVTLFDVPKDFDVKASADYFKNGIKDFPGKWVYKEDTTPAEGINNIYTLTFYDSAKNPVNPAIVRVDYFMETGKDTYTVTVSTTIY